MNRADSTDTFQKLCALLLIAPTVALAEPVTDAGEAGADANSGIALQEVVVTATRRETNVQDVPIAMSAIGGEALKERGITDPYQLSGLAPSLNVDQGQGNGMTHVSIRGLASNSFGLEANSPISTYIDDIYQPYMFGLATQIYDLNRVEVLRGPQGTLFGKNTTGGSLNYFTQAPTRKQEGYVTADAGGGDFGRFSVEGAFNQPIGDNLAGRVSLRLDRRNDYITNLYNNTKLGSYTNFSGRAQLQWTPSTETTVNLKIFGLKGTGDAPVYVSGRYLQDPCASAVAFFYMCDANGVPTPASRDSRHVYSEAPQFERYDSYGVVLNARQNFGDYTLTSITNAQKGHYSVATNDDGTASDFFHSRQIMQNWQASQEFRLATPVSAPLSAVAGLFAQYTNVFAQEGSISNSPLVDPLFQYDLDQYNGTDDTTAAVFSSITYRFNNVFSLLGGVRESVEHIHSSLAQLQQFGRQLSEDDVIFNQAMRDFQPDFGDFVTPFNGAHDWNKFTWDVTANAKPTDATLLYAKVATGFRSGGFFNAPTGAPQAYITLAPEQVKSYEVGWKTEWLEHRLRVNGAAFWMDYTNMQVQTTNSNGPGLAYANAAAARIKGAELEIEYAPVRGLTLSGGTGYSHAAYVKYDTIQFSVPVSLAGNALPYAPKWTANLALDYEYVLGSNSVTFDTNWRYRSAIFFDPNGYPQTEDPARVLGDIRVGYGQRGRGWRLTAYVENVDNVNMKSFGYFSASGNSILVAPGIYAPQRTWGGEFNYTF